MARGEVNQVWTVWKMFFSSEPNSCEDPSLYCQLNNIPLYPESRCWTWLFSTVGFCGQKGTEEMERNKYIEKKQKPNTSAAVAVQCTTQAVLLGGTCLA